MRRVWSSRGVLLSLVVMLAASFVFLGSGSHNVEASAFAPTMTARTCSPGTGDVGGPSCTPLSSPGATATISQTADWGTGIDLGGFGRPFSDNRAFPASSVYFTPNGWGIPDCSPTGSCPYAYDEKTGTFLSITTFGLLNGQCILGVGPPFVAFPDGMRNASTDPNDSISPGPGFADLNADVNPANGIPDGMEHWNTLLGGLQAAGILPATPPRERQILRTVALGTPVWVDVLTYDPGLLGGAATAPLGSATTFILENANPLQPPAPGAITDTCGLFQQFSQSALAAGGAVHRSNPTTPGTKAFGLNSGSSRDADQGPSAPAEPTVYPFPPPSGGLDGSGLVNNIDTCPFQPNFGSPLAPAGAPFTGDEEPASFPDGIDSACDPNPTAFDGTDTDGDGYQNRGDNCPLVANGPFQDNQQDLGEFLSGPPVDGGPASDGIGDDCDLNPTVADGHFHTKLNLAPLCITGGPFTDGDGDGWCGAEEAALGSSPTNSASTPESLQVPGSCSDGADNDADGSGDLNDTGCQLPLLDLSIKKFNGSVSVPCSGGTVPYTLLVNNPSATDTVAEVSIYIDSQPSYVPAPGPNPAPGKSAGSVGGFSATFGGGITGSGPINIDGDADVEWLAKAALTVKKSPATTAINFNITYPAQASCSGAGTTDFVLTADVCHGNDVAPLGVAPLNGNCAGSATSDGSQDRNSGNDIATKNIDAQ